VRILSVNHLLDTVTGGGTAERLFQLSRLLSSAGMECAVLTLDIGIDDARRSHLKGVTIVAVPCVLRRFFVPWISWRRLKREVAAADVVHVMGHWTLLNALVCLAARAAGRPYVLCPAGALAIIGRSRPLKRLYNFLVGDRMLRGAAGHIAIAESEIPDFSRHGIARERIELIPNGAPVPLSARDCTQFMQRHRLTQRRFVLFLGRLAYIKGPDLLLEAYANAAGRLADLDLVYAGPDDGMLAGLKRDAARRGLQGRVHFIGYVAGADKACALQGCAFLAVPSRQEAMSIVALEAGTYAKPVLLTDRCGFDDVERAGGGRVVPATVQSIERALEQMAADPAGLARMGERLRAHVQDHYTWERAARRHAALFRQVARQAEPCGS
jgi:glycosyltransferase involved in cell wall biosynthesis